MSRAWNKKKAQEYDHTRAICYFLAASSPNRSKALPPIEKWWPLPTDEKQEENTGLGLMEKRKLQIELLNKNYNLNLQA